MHILHAQIARSLAQLQQAKQQLVSGMCQVFLRLEKLALGVEHVQIDAHTYLVAEHIGFQRTLAGSDRSFQCLDLFIGRLHAKEGRAHGLGDLASGAFQICAGFFLE